jgi:calcium-dependent protein kinase
VLTYLASNTISKEERRVLAMKFNEIDKDRSGVIDRSELIDAYKSLYQVVEDEPIERILNNLDTNGSGKVDFTEFMVAAH